jgi:acetoacetate decarboxylase
MNSEFFQGIVRWEVERNGTRRKLPYFYQDCLALQAGYTASTKEVRKLLPHPDLHPVEIIPGHCLVAFLAWQCRETDVEPFDEVLIAFGVTYPRRGVFALSAAKMMISRVLSGYSWKIATNSEFSRAGGVDLLDAPKYIAEIQFRQEAEWVHCSLREAGVEVLHLQGRILPTRRGNLIHNIAYWFNCGNQLVSNALINPLELAQTLDSQDFKLDIGADHPICEALSKLKLSKRPLFYQYMPRFEQILFPARNIQDR